MKKNLSLTIFWFIITLNGFSQWQDANNGLNGGTIYALAIDPTTGYIYAGTASGGVFLSTNNGSNWIAVNNGLSGMGKYVLSLAISDSTIFAGTYGGGIFSSNDNGKNWMALNNGISGDGYYVQIIAISDSNIFAGTDGAGILFSSDRGNSWIAANNGLTSNNVFSLAISDSTIFAGTSGNGLWKRLISDLIYLDVSTNFIIIGDEANSTGSFDLTTSLTKNWTASSSETWLTVYPSGGSGDTTIILTAQANPTTSTRTATVTVSGAGVPAKTITVIQEGIPAYLNISTPYLQLSSSDGASDTFKIITNTTWSVSGSETWLTLNPQSGSGDNTVTATAKWNPTINIRNATVIVSGTGATSQMLTVLQDGGNAGIGNVDHNKIIIYPNPARNILVVEGADYGTNISVINLQGIVLLSKTLIDDQIDISRLANGIYTIKFESKSGITTKQFIKQ